MTLTLFTLVASATTEREGFRYTRRVAVGQVLAFSELETNATDPLGNPFRESSTNLKECDRHVVLSCSSCGVLVPNDFSLVFVSVT